MSLTCTVYTPHGVILRIVHGTDLETILLNVEEGELVLIGSYPADQYYVKDEEAVPFPEKPGPWAVFDFAGGQWIDPRTPEDHAAELATAKTEGIAKINGVAGQIRAQFITVIPGQEMLYLLKEQEALEWLMAEDANLADFPLIAAEVGITGPTAYDVATAYVYQGRGLRLVAAPLETLRLGSVAAVEAATDVETVTLALQTFMENLPHDPNS